MVLALVVALAVLVVLASVSDEQRHAQQELRSDTGAGGEQLHPGMLPRARDLPVRDRLTPWEQVETADERLPGCQPETGLVAEEVLRRTFTARIAADDEASAGAGVAAEVRMSVLQFVSGPDADTGAGGPLRDLMLQAAGRSMPG